MTEWNCCIVLCLLCTETRMAVVRLQWNVMSTGHCTSFFCFKMPSFCFWPFFSQDPAWEAGNCYFYFECSPKILGIIQKKLLLQMNLYSFIVIFCHAQPKKKQTSAERKTLQQCHSLEGFFFWRQEAVLPSTGPLHWQDHSKKHLEGLAIQCACVFSAYYRYQSPCCDRAYLIMVCITF